MALAMASIAFSLTAYPRSMTRGGHVQAVAVCRFRTTAALLQIDSRSGSGIEIQNALTESMRHSLQHRLHVVDLVLHLLCGSSDFFHRSVRRLPDLQNLLFLICQFLCLSFQRRPFHVLISHKGVDGAA